MSIDAFEKREELIRLKAKLDVAEESRLSVESDEDILSVSSKLMSKNKAVYEELSK